MRDKAALYRSGRRLELEGFGAFLGGCSSVTTAFYHARSKYRGTWGLKGKTCLACSLHSNLWNSLPNGPGHQSEQNARRERGHSSTSSGRLPARSRHRRRLYGCVTNRVKCGVRFLSVLRNADLKKLRRRLPHGYPYSDLFRFTQVSVDALDETTRRCYLALGVLIEDMTATPAIQEALWDQDDGEALETAESFISLSLAERCEDGIRLHDLHLNYARALCPWRASLGLIHDALRLSLPAVSEDPKEFVPQLTGRLFHFRNRSEVAICYLSDTLVRSVRHTSLIPLFGGLAGPGTPLKYTLPWDGRQIAISADGTRAVIQHSARAFPGQRSYVESKQPFWRYWATQGAAI